MKCFIFMMRFILRCALFDEMFYLMMRFILIQSKLYLIKSFIPPPFQSFPNRFYPFLSNSKNFKQNLSIACL